MGAGPSKEQVQRRKRQIVQKLGKALAERMGKPCAFAKGMAAVGDVVIDTKLLRASNGEVCMWVIARSPKGILSDPPWGDEPATVDNIMARLV
jgi:hypothetical protein